jgi:rare lipoprotein A (peptidoglycan hydrolase)
VNDYDGSHGGHVEFRGGGNASPQATTRKGGGMTGLATYYTGSGGSDGVAGGPTANGEKYNPKAMTAAVQWSLRGKYLNKWVQVEDLETGKRVRVWVNDVGQMGGTEKSVNKEDPRTIDLSPAAFTKLFGSTGRGVGRIRIVEG